MLRSISLVSVLATALAVWTVISPNVATICTGISCTDQTHCYIPVAANGVGCDILHSADGGVTWAGTQEEPFALLLLDIAATGQNIVALGALTLEYSLDGASTFNSSGAPFGAGQCIRSVGPPGSAPGGANAFAAVGDWGLFSESNGPAISDNNGMNFTADNITSLTSDSRYGAFPSATTWYIAAGDWPGEGSDDNTNSPTTPAGGVSRGPLFKLAGAEVDPAHYAQTVAPGSVLVKARGARLHLLRTPSGDHLWAQVRREAMKAANMHAGAAAPDTWEAQIVKSTDAGKTWDLQFTKIGAFYFNEIECTDENTCCVVAETGSGTNGTEGAGTFIHCTGDGGATWVETNVNPDPDSSLIAIDHIGPKEFWAAGAELGFISPDYATFWHTLDGGVTWALESKNITLQYAIDLSCDAPYNCWAPLLDVLTQETSIARLNN